MDANDAPLFGSSLPPSLPPPPRRLNCFRQYRENLLSARLSSDGSLNRVKNEWDFKNLDFTVEAVSVGATVSTCEAKCYAQGFKYFSLQWWGKCFCGNSYGRFGLKQYPNGAACPYPTKDSYFGWVDQNVVYEISPRVEYVNKMIAASIRVESGEGLKMQVDLMGGNYIGNGAFKHGFGLSYSDNSIFTNPVLAQTIQVVSISDGPVGEPVFCLSLHPVFQDIPMFEYYGQSTPMICSSGSYTISAYLRCSINFNGDRSLLSAYFKDANGVIVGQAGGVFPATCNNAWEKVESHFDSGDKFVCSVSVLAGKNLQHSAGTVQLTDLKLSPSTIVDQSVRLVPLGSSTRVFHDIRSYKYGSIPSSLADASVVQVAARSGEMGGEQMKITVNEPVIAYMTAPSAKYSIGTDTFSDALLRDGWKQEAKPASWIVANYLENVTLFSKPSNEDNIITLPPSNPYCPWVEGHAAWNILKCVDGTTCNIKTSQEKWACCKAHKGRLQCPKNYPIMCGNPNDCDDGSDFCCGTDVSCRSTHGGVRTCRGYDAGILLKRKKATALEQCTLKGVDVTINAT